DPPAHAESAYAGYQLDEVACPLLPGRQLLPLELWVRPQLERGDQPGDLFLPHLHRASDAVERTAVHRAGLDQLTFAEDQPRALCELPGPPSRASPPTAG